MSLKFMKLQKFQFKKKRKQLIPYNKKKLMTYN